MKNIFAVIGFIVVAKKGYELYREYREMKHEREEREERAANRERQPE
ncbi:MULTISPECIES: hypothetical protein [Pseudomonas]|nr:MULTISPECIES: hypothetical protein [Pseudomonas]MBJ7560077.1 hypothetical protein [Pseudomonas sp. P20]MBJ7566717.1 hypothetical protein [Pseudomonas sp. P22]MBM0727251.1 hypothetical protein [Pseudomonas aeruginosa]MBM2511197.1 hypothetical protein [Pseudomonas aeruginosa]MBM2527490.1 hypothetical protein [Pseudomonas aeruginosa]